MILLFVSKEFKSFSLVFLPPCPEGDYWPVLVSRFKQIYLLGRRANKPCKSCMVSGADSYLKILFLIYLCLYVRGYVAIFGSDKVICYYEAVNLGDLVVCIDIIASGL